MMSNRRKLNREPDLFTALAAQLDREQNVRGTVVAQIGAQAQNNPEAVRHLLPSGDDPAALANALVTAIGIAAELLTEVTDGDQSAMADRLQAMWQTVPFGD